MLNHVINAGSSDEKHSALFVRAHIKRYRGKPGEAFTEFRALANSASVPPGLKRQCMRLAAGCAHAAKNYPDAWFSFSHIAETDTDPAAVAEARVELAGLAWELVYCGKGTWDETRALCEVILQDPNTPHRFKATAAIMHLETWFNEQNYTKSLAEAEDFLRNYSDVKREAGLVRVWRGLNLLNLRRVAEAKAALEEAALQDLASDELFAGDDPRAVASSWLVFVAKAQNQNTDVQRWSTILSSKYPQSKAAQNLGLSTAVK